MTDRKGRERKNGRLTAFSRDGAEALTFALEVGVGADVDAGGGHGVRSWLCLWSGRSDGTG